MLSLVVLAACSGSDGTRSYEHVLGLRGQPSGPIEANGSIWVLNSDSGKLLRIDPATRKTEATIDLGIKDSASLFAEGDTLEVTGFQSAAVDLDTNEHRSTSDSDVDRPDIVVGDAHYDFTEDGQLEARDPGGGDATPIEAYILLLPVAADEEAVYVPFLDGSVKSLGRLDPTSNVVTLLHDIEGDYVSIAVAGDIVWLLHRDRRLYGYDTTSGEPVAGKMRIPDENAELVSQLYDGPNNLVVADDGTMWAIDLEAKRLFELDAVTGAVISNTKLTYRPFSVLVTADAVWINNLFDKRVTVIDRASITAAAASTS